MSDSARRVLAFRWALRELLAYPRNTPEWERQVIDMEWRLQRQADHVIGWGC